MINPYEVVVDVIVVADTDEAYGTYAVDDECFVNHDYDDDTDDDKAWRRRDLLLAGQPTGRLAAPSALSAPCPKKIFDSENPGSSKKKVNGVFCNFLPCLPEPRKKVYIPVFQGAGDWKINLFL